VAAVNELQPLGKGPALERVAARRADQDALGLFWVLRTLFDVPSDPGHPPVRLGQPEPPEPDDPSALPRFPIVLALDLPLLAVRGYALAGLPEPVEAHIAYYREHGSVRASPLAPPAGGAGVEAEFARLWGAGEHRDEALALVREQLRRAYG
jgi:hypothetical protein